MIRLALACALLASTSAAHATVEYAIDLTSPEHHSARVAITFPQAPGGTLDVKMPAWRPGKYQILNFANGVSAFTASDAAGRPLTWTKVDKSTWRIQRSGSGPVHVAYDLYANELGLRTRHIDDSHAYLDAAAVFMYADPTRRDDLTVSLKVPQGWQSYSGMSSAGAQQFRAANYDVLADSPIETGINHAYRFDEGGRQYQVVFWGDGNYDAQQTVGDLRKIVAQARTIWSGYPFQRYVFIIHATDAIGGATEHRNSTVIQFPRYYFQPHRYYLRFLATASHEFIHTWNVKAYRNAAMVPYHYQEENYSDLLWLEEGSTDYFADHLLLRAGLMSPAEYLGDLSQAINHHRDTPGASLQSVADRSFNEWIAPSGDRATNAWADIYPEGSLVSWMLDIALLQDTQGRVSYRDVHEALYRRYPSDQGRGFTSADVRGILQELTGHSWDAWWARNVDRPEQVDFAQLLAPVGLALTPGAGVRAAAGWSGDAAEGGIRLTGVERGSAAWNAGFVPDDIVAAFDGKRITKDRFSAALAEHRPGDRISVSFFRRDQLMTKQLTLGSEPAEDPEVVPVDEPTAAQKALFQRWLLIPYPGAAGA